MNNIVIAKLGGMRKWREWSVVPTDDDRIIVQADGAIGILDWRTGEGRLCTQGGYFPHLAIAKPYAFPPAFVHACPDACPSPGGSTEIAGGVAIIEHTGRMRKSAED